MADKTPKINTEVAIATMAKDIHYMKETLGRLEVTLTDQIKNNITRLEFETYKSESLKDLVEYKGEIEKNLTDKETRLRVSEMYITRILTWGSAGILILGIVQFILSKYIN